MKGNNYFWVSLSDLMISMFFVMLVLFAISIAILHNREKVSREALAEIDSIQQALEGLDKDFFDFDEINKRYKLKVDVRFRPNSYDINDIPLDDRQNILNAGNSLFLKMKELIENNSHIDYLVIIEGNTQRFNNNYIDNPDLGYIYSYQRALSLVNFWKLYGVDFKKLGPQCEIIIAGSGYFGYSRDESNEGNNRKFSIQVTSKVGKYFDSLNF